MQTFSIAAGSYEGFDFRVNPVDTSIVEFHFTAPGVDGDTHDGEHVVIAQFKRNGGLIGVTRVPVARAPEVVRDSLTGKPSLPAAAVEPKGSDLNDGYEPTYPGGVGYKQPYDPNRDAAARGDYPQTGAQPTPGARDVVWPSAPERDPAIPRGNNRPVA